MNLLPRLLFLFQSLPIRVPASTLKMLDKPILTFIWQKKRPRVRLKSLQLPKDKGGLGLPNLKIYYWAAQINAIVAWLGNDREAIWTKIEQDSVKGVSLSVLPFMDIKSVNKIKIKNEWIKHTLKVWTTVKKNGQGTAIDLKGHVDSRKYRVPTLPVGQWV